jgi:hypothetical protein
MSSLKKLLLFFGLLASVALVVRASTDEPYGSVVVYKNVSVGTSNVSATTIYTPSSDGWYGIRMDFAWTSGSSCSGDPKITWTDAVTGLGGSIVDSGQNFAYAKSSDPIQFQVTGYAGSCTYTIAYEVVKE